MILEILLLSLASIIVFIIWKIKKIYSFWEGTDIPHHSLFDYLKEEWTRTKVPYNEYALWRYRRIPKVFGSYNGFQPKLVIADPDLVRQVLVKDFVSFTDRFPEPNTRQHVWNDMVLNTSGEVWKKQRSIMTPAFSSGKMKQMFPVMTKLADRVVEIFLADARKGVSTDIKTPFRAYTMDTIAKLVFATNLNSHVDTKNPFLKYAEGLFGPGNAWKFTLLILFPRIFNFLRLQLIQDEAEQFLSAIIKKIIHERNSANMKSNDLLQLLLNARAEDSSNNASNDKTSKGISNEEIMSQAIMFFMVALDTTTSALVFTAYNLAMNPEAQDKLIKEIDTVVGQSEITYESLPNMPYLEACISETLRFTGADPFVLRTCTQDTTLAGVKLKKGMFVEISHQGMHHDREYFPDPDNFYPDRLLPENKGSIQPYTLLPFGEGPRHCIGMRLSMFQMKACLTKVFQKIRFETCPETPNPVKFAPNSFTPESVVPIYLRPVERI